MFKTVKRIITWIGPYKKRLYWGVVCSFLATWCTALPIIIAAQALGRVLKDMSGEAPLSSDIVWQALLLIGAAVLLRFIFSYARARLQDSIGTERTARERIRIGDMLKRVSLGYFEKNSTGEILADLTSEFSQIEIHGMKMIDTFVNGYINLAAIVIFLCTVSWQAALTAVAGVFLSHLALRGINRQSVKSSPVNRRAGEALSGAIIEFSRGLPIVKSYGQEGAAIKAFREACIESRRINIAIEKAYVPWNVLHLFALKLASVVIVLIAAQFTMAGSAAIPEFLLLAMFTFFMFGGVEAINDSAHVLGMIGSALDKIEQLEQTEFIDQSGSDITLEKYDIVFDRVSFGYDGNEVIHDVSFTAEQNTTTAIVGPSGSGKTTLLNLMARFYDVNGGNVRIGGHDLRDFTCDSLLRHFSMVFQNVYLFRDTIRNNILFGKPEATEEEMVAAAKAARCHDFITTLPEGYDTQVGEGGSSLSGGEKQRISIARAILKNAPVVILDEATASIDPENEHLIQEALSALTRGKTIITIAHRLATIEHADKILVLEKGRIVQQGTHEELMAKEGIYRNFVSIRERAEGWSIA